MSSLAQQLESDIQAKVNAELSKKYPATVNCSLLSVQIDQLKNDIEHYYTTLNPKAAQRVEVFLATKQVLFTGGGCALKLEAKIQKETKNILDYYSDKAETSVVYESITTRNILFVIGATTILMATIILFGSLNKKKK